MPGEAEMRRIKVELSEQPSGTWGWVLKIHSDLPGDLLCRAADLGRTRGWVAYDSSDGEATDVEACMYSANNALMELYDWVDRNEAFNASGLLISGVPARRHVTIAGPALPTESGDE
jgi:hypothetical protein